MNSPVQMEIQTMDKAEKDPEGKAASLINQPPIFIFADFVSIWLETAIAMIFNIYQTKIHRGKTIKMPTIIGVPEDKRAKLLVNLVYRLERQSFVKKVLKWHRKYQPLVTTYWKLLIQMIRTNEAVVLNQDGTVSWIGLAIISILYREHTKRMSKVAQYLPNSYVLRHRQLVHVLLNSKYWDLTRPEVEGHWFLLYQLERVTDPGFEMPVMDIHSNDCYHVIPFGNLKYGELIDDTPLTDIYTAQGYDVILKKTWRYLQKRTIKWIEESQTKKNEENQDTNDNWPTEKRFSRKDERTSRVQIQIYHPEDEKDMKEDENIQNYIEESSDEDSESAETQSLP